MNVRQWLNQNSVVVTLAAVALLLIALGAVLLQQRGPTRPIHDVYFWDLQTDQLFVLPGDARPPVTAPSGGQGVRAHLYTCGECVPEQWVGYLESYSPQGQRLLERGEAPEDAHLVVRDLRGERWVPYDGPEADDVLAVMYLACDDPRPCLP